MENRFFEGADFQETKFKALLPEYYPPKYQEYIRLETALLKNHLQGLNRVLEAGVGIGRMVPELAPLVKEFIGIDNADLMLKEARALASDFSNVKIINGDIDKLSELFPTKYFDATVCIWNTLGNVEDEISTLKKINHVTSGSIFLTTYLKGTIEDRKNWYETVGVKLQHIDTENEIFYSESGLRSKSYSVEDVKNLAQASQLEIKDTRILAEVMLWVELQNKQGKLPE